MNVFRDIVSDCIGHRFFKFFAWRRKGFKRLNPRFLSIILFIYLKFQSENCLFSIPNSNCLGACFAMEPVVRVLSGGDWLSKNSGTRRMAERAGGSEPTRKASAADRSLACLWWQGLQRLFLQAGFAAGNINLPPDQGLINILSITFN